MRITRLVAGTVTAGLLGLAPIAIAAPSQATDNLTTTTAATPSATAARRTATTSTSSVDLASSDGYSRRYRRHRHPLRAWRPAPPRGSRSPPPTHSGYVASTT